MIFHFLEFILLLFHAICFVANWRLVDSRFTETQILEVNSWISKDSCTTSTVSDMLSNGNCQTNQLQKYVIYISILAFLLLQLVMVLQKQIFQYVIIVKVQSAENANAFRINNFQKLLRCIQECFRDYSIVRYDKICVQDNRIKSIIKLFNDIIIQKSNQFRYYSFIFLFDKFYPKNTDLIKENCNGISFIGNLQFSERMLYQLNLQESIKFLRIHITFYLFNFQDSSKIEILHNNQTLSRIIKDPLGFQHENLITIFEKIDNCFKLKSFFNYQIKIQQLYFKDYYNKKNVFWGFRNVTIDSGFVRTIVRFFLIILNVYNVKPGINYIKVNVKFHFLFIHRIVMIIKISFNLELKLYFRFKLHCKRVLRFEYDN
ncbi:unnamed protein product [Paramecium pentaurelia]|uniref:Transmembrane protein n=1 Tax=Paramecium pentaurelia TaxID=43138 RepID=A0A8S1XMH2_9CILI|nr:unnamed protein product [Paramecium pentaurelia]